MVEFREDFIRIIASAINREAGVINRFPTIHATEMAREYGDDVKILCFRSIADLAKLSSVRFYYLGYFDHTPLIDKMNLLPLAINQTCAMLTDALSDRLVFVYELNMASHKAISQGYNDSYSHYLRAALGDSLENTKNSVGRYYCDKFNFHMAVTDTASYVRNLKAKASEGENVTEFKKCILNAAGHIADMFRLDEVIQINKWPYYSPGSGPVRYASPVVPSDHLDLSSQHVEFMERLRVYWEQKFPERK